MPSNVSVGTVFGGTLALTPTGGTLNATSYNATIVPGGEAYLGFQGSDSPYIPPSDFTLDGQTCTSG